jgi:PEGA domain
MIRYLSNLPIHLLALGVLMVVAALYGCAAHDLRSERGHLVIQSTPPGAAVIVAGKELGVTPLKVDAADVFPLHYDVGQEALYGTVVIRAKGCKDFHRRVDHDTYNTGIITAALDCRYKPANGSAGG